MPESESKPMYIVTGVQDAAVGSMTGLSEDGVTVPHAILQLDLEIVNADDGSDPFNRDHAHHHSVMVLLPAPVAEHLTTAVMVPMLPAVMAMGFRHGDYKLEPIPDEAQTTTFYVNHGADDRAEAEVTELRQQSSRAEQAAGAHQLAAVDQQGPQVWWGKCACGQPFSELSSAAVEMAHRTHQRQMIRLAAGATPNDQQERSDPPTGA